MVAACGCHPDHPQPAPLADQTIEIGRANASLAGVAADGERTYAALTSAKRTTIEARKGDAVAWHADVAGTGGLVARTGGLLAAVTTATGDADGTAIHGEPGTLLTALDAATGRVVWRTSFDASEWTIASAIAATPDGGIVVGGSFSGTMRATSVHAGAAQVGAGSAQRFGEPAPGVKLVSSAARVDGYIAKLSADGDVAWLVRFGGPGADATQGVAAAGDRVAFAGTFAGGAEVQGEPLDSFDAHSPLADVVVGELDLATGAKKWVRTFGGPSDDAAAGVAIDTSGRLVVAAIAREVVHVNGQDLFVKGPADGVVAWWGPDGAPGPALRVGGDDFDGLRGIATSGDVAIVGGFYSGKLTLGDRTLTAGGGDDSFLAALDPAGHVVRVWPITGDGREEITSLLPAPGGFVAGVAHTAAASVDKAALPSPSDPLTGAGIVVRGIR